MTVANPEVALPRAPDRGLDPGRLAPCALLAPLGPAGLARLARLLDDLTVPTGTVVVHEGESAGELYVVISGEAQLVRRGVELRSLAPGDVFGEIGLVTGRPRAATVTASSTLTLARLTRPRYDELLATEPTVANALLQALLARVADELVAMTDGVGMLLSERSLPRRTELTVRLGDRRLHVAMGTPVGTLLPDEVDGYQVVGGLIENKVVSLGTRLVADATLEPLTTDHWEGRSVFRHCAGLVALEAASLADPTLKLRVDGTLGGSQALEVDGPEPDWEALAARIDAELRKLIQADVPIREELWTVEEARTHFLEHGWDDAARLLAAWRISRVLLVTCGRVYALSPGPLLPSTGSLANVRVVAVPHGLRLEFGEAMRRHLPERSPRDDEGPPPDDSEMARAHKGWLRAFDVSSVGCFNERCISGRVAEIIRVAEGFHEKRLGGIADRIAAAHPRVICIAGPSSSGKTTFIKRLTTQLRVNGVNPVALSLDDYYVDREKTPRDEAGEFDFESFDAIDSKLLASQIARAIAGEKVATAHYDFKSGRSHPTGGAQISLGRTDVLMLEGIHGLNPRLLGDDVAPDEVFRVFIHPATALPLDRLSPVNTADLRLLRRIVRDRHGRGYHASETIMRWPSVRRGERRHIFPFLPHADVVFDSALAYEPSVLKVYADQYLLEVKPGHPAYGTAFRLRTLLDRYVTIYPDHVPPTSILREFIGGSGFEY